MPDDPKLHPGDDLLVAAPLAWREACFSVPALRALKRRGVRLEILCPEAQADFWRATGMELVRSYGPKAGVRDIAAMATCRRTLVWEAGTAADAFAKAGVPRRMGPALPELVKRLTDPIPVLAEPGPPRHRVRLYLDLVARMGAETMVAENFNPVRLGVPRASERMLLAPDSDFGQHFTWPADHWKQVAGGLLERGYTLRIATGGPVAKALATALPDVETVEIGNPGRSLDDLASCAGCVTADNSLAHLAAHVGTSCVVLFGPGEPEETRPLGRQHVIVRQKAECAPCRAPKCVMDLRCQTELTPAAVLAAVPKLEAV